MKKHSQIRSIVRLACLSLLAISVLSFFASCSSGSDDPVAPKATIEDFTGYWASAPNEDEEIECLMYFSIPTPGVCTFSSLYDLTGGLVAVNNGTATLTEYNSGHYYSGDDIISVEIGSNSWTFERDSGTAGSIAGEWIMSPEPGTTVTLTISMTSATSGTFTSATNGTPDISGSVLFDSTDSLVTFMATYGTAVLNSAKDTMTLTLTGESTPYVLTPYEMPVPEK
jgi:hypothetical protein